MRTFIRIPAFVLAAAIGAAALAGCQPEYRPEDHGEGDALTHNFMVQAVNPRPNETAVAPDQDGQRASDAYQRYRDGKVIKPSKAPTSELSIQVTPKQ